MDRKDVFLALQFQYYSILNNQVEAITAVQFDAFVLDRQRDLALKNKTPQVKFATQTDFVRGFEQAWTKRTMYFDGRSDDLLRELFMKKFAPCLGVSVVNHVCSTPTLNSATSGFSDAASNACVIACRVSIGSIILSIQSRAAP
jgi:hypothetical protein